jgi:hypothetical protein
LWRGIGKSILRCLTRRFRLHHDLVPRTRQHLYILSVVTRSARLFHVRFAHFGLSVFCKTCTPVRFRPYLRLLGTPSHFALQSRANFVAHLVTGAKIGNKLRPGKIT